MQRQMMRVTGAVFDGQRAFKMFENSSTTGSAAGSQT
jgi:hypothetical protein